ncbi:hypothetical protein [Streptomyces sp. NPDC006739]|uniref:hypothetical protein n=1 Tax=Streptomyces sp. NPDC006739 TaxID=3364763 RepID=UPI0036BD66B2
MTDAPAARSSHVRQQFMRRAATRPKGIELLKRLSTAELRVDDPPQIGEPLVLPSATC